MEYRENSLTYEEYVSLAINVMTYLIRACVKNKTKIRIVYGTAGHEMEQYRLFNYHFTSSKVDVKLFTTVTEERINKDTTILYVPEEYIFNKHDFYKESLYSNKKYNYIFGHGVIEEGMPAAVSYGRSSNNTEKQVPHFKAGEFSEISDLTVFGHYHQYVEMSNNVFYLGSLFRDSFGEETPKGYGIIENGKFTFVENTEAYVYKTYKFEPESEIYEDVDELIREIEKIKSENSDVFSGEKVGKIRLIFQPSEDNVQQFKENIKDILFNDKIIKVMIQEVNTSIIEETKEEVSDEYEFILDNSLKITDKIYQFINKQYEDVISLEELTKYINEPLTL